MPDSVVTTNASTVVINDVKNIGITEIQPDDDGFVREIRIYGSSALSVNAVLVHTVRIKSTARVELEVTTPNVNF